MTPGGFALSCVCWERASTQITNRFFRSLIAKLLVGPFARIAAFIIGGQFSSEGGSHENSVHRPRRCAVIYRPLVRDGGWHHSPGPEFQLSEDAMNDFVPFGFVVLLVALLVVLDGGLALIAIDRLAQSEVMTVTNAPILF